MKKNQFLFFDGSAPSEQVIDYRKRLEQSDILLMISPCYNLRATAILENWVDLVSLQEIDNKKSYLSFSPYQFMWISNKY